MSLCELLAASVQTRCHWPLAVAAEYDPAAADTAAAAVAAVEVERAWIACQVGEDGKGRSVEALAWQSAAVTVGQEAAQQLPR